MDGVPIFNLVRETLPALRVLGFRGVVNSTTNFILTAMEHGAAVRGGARRDAGARDRGGRSRRSTSTAGTRQPRPRRWPTCCWARTSRRRTWTGTASGPTPGRWRARRGAAGTGLKLVARAERHGTAASRRASRSRSSRGDDLLAGLEGQQNALDPEDAICSSEIAIVQRGGSLTQTAYALLSRLWSRSRRAAIAARVSAPETIIIRHHGATRRNHRSRSDARALGSVLHDAARRHGRARHQDRTARQGRRHARLGSAVSRAARARTSSASTATRKASRSTSSTPEGRAILDRLIAQSRRARRELPAGHARQARTRLRVARRRSIRG